jgi:hypothetical protein
MPILSRPSSAAPTAVLYVTAGALIQVWTVIWYWYLYNHPPLHDATYYWCYGFFLTGLTLFIIGLTLGRIGRAARHAELPPAEATPAAKKAELDAAARAPVVAPTNPGMAVANGSGPSSAPAAPVSGAPAVVVAPAPPTVHPAPGMRQIKP